MDTQKIPQNVLEDTKVSVKVKIATLWASFMFLYSYVDYFSLYMPDKLEGILEKKVFVFDITQGFVFTALALATIPMLMIYLSITLKAKINRWTNIIAATVHIPYMLFNLAGEVWIHMVFAAFVEVVLLCLIICYAWKWSD